eukprot:6472237-Amphidinium_carterae.1
MIAKWLLVIVLTSRPCLATIVHAGVARGPSIGGAGFRDSPAAINVWSSRPNPVIQDLEPIAPLDRVRSSAYQPTSRYQEQSCQTRPQRFGEKRVARRGSPFRNDGAIIASKAGRAVHDLLQVDRTHVPSLTSSVPLSPTGSLEVQSAGHAHPDWVPDYLHPHPFPHERGPQEEWDGIIIPIEDRNVVANGDQLRQNRLRTAASNQHQQ